MKVKKASQRVSNGESYMQCRCCGRVRSLIQRDRLYKTNLPNFLTTNHPINHAECHLQHALSSTRRNTFNRNVVKLLDSVLEWQNSYSLTVNVVVPLHNMLIKLWLRVCSYVSRMVSVLSTIRTGRID